MRRLSGLLLLFPSLCAYPQEPMLPGSIQQLIETHTQEGEEQEALALFEDYQQYLEHPLDLNNASAAELRQFPLFNEFQVQSLLGYRQSYGALFSLHELALIHGFNAQLAAQLSPFLCVSPVNPYKKDSWRERLSQGRHQLLLRSSHTLEERKGYSNEASESMHYLGFPWSLYLRYKYNFHQQLQWGITATNGAGEPFFKGENAAGFDFYSAHFLINGLNKYFKRIVIGDYQATFGQGLVVWSGGGRLSGGVLTVKKQERGFSAHTGSDENRFFRGIGVTAGFGKWVLSGFCSYKHIDATMDEEGFTSLPVSGLHHTAGSMAQKRRLPELVTGANLSFSWKRLKIGSTLLWHRYGAENRRELKPYSLFELSERQNANAGIDVSFLWQRCQFFGEFALSANGGKAGIAGLVFDFAHDFRWSTVYRNYGVNYQASYAGAFGNNSKTANEQGWYTGLEWMPLQSLTISLSADGYSFPWLRYGVNAPSSGWRYQLQADWQSTPTTGMRWQLRQAVKAANAVSEEQTAAIIMENRNTSFRYGINYEPLPRLRMEERIELCFTDGRSRETDLLLYHDTAYRFPQAGLSCSFRLALFDTGGWEARIYAYEHDVLGAFSVPAYYAQGIRWIANLHWQWKRRLDVWLHAAQTRYNDKSSIGSGGAAIEGQVQSDIKLQLRLSL